jgi:hypothetical protein
MEPNLRQRGVIKREQVRLDEPEPRGPRPSPASAACGRAPAVRLVRVDEHTQAFEFTCSCGEVSLIEIQYEKKP